VTAHSDQGSIFRSKKYTEFATIAEEFKQGKLKASFILAPLAMTLRRQGLPIKIVYLGHRDGTTIIVGKDSNIHSFADLRGKKIAIPHRYSNQRILLARELEKFHMNPGDLEMVVYPPPEMPSALQKGVIDAYIVGEPFAAKSEMAGFGRVLAFTKDMWPDFISCVLAVREDVIRDRRADVQALVDGIAKSGKWLDQSMDHRMNAAKFVSKNYYMQDPRLLTFVLSKPPDRVKYTRLTPLKPDFEEIEALGKASGILNGTAHFEDYVDPSFAEVASGRVEAWKFDTQVP
jgi:NitT/TauT family transport system substrate-binding protein